MGDVVNRIHVAMPRARDGMARPPVIPPGVAAARARREAGEKRKTEKDLQARRSFWVAATKCVCACKAELLIYCKPCALGDRQATY